VEWVPAAGSHEDPDYGYALAIRALGSEHTLTIDDLGSAPHAYFDDLEPGLTYFFQVCACNSQGFGEWSNSSDGYIVPRPPCDLFASRRGEHQLSFSDSATSAVLQWNEPCNHGAQITGYNVQYAANPSELGSIVTLTCLNRRTSVEITDLLPNTVYYFRTQAINDVGMSDWTDWSHGVATMAVEPEQPAPPKLQEATANELSIFWERPNSCGFRIIK
jgi:hypothetical protein